MNVPHRFKCHDCEEWHEGFPDIVYDQPEYAAAVPDEERAARITLDDDLCVVDGEHFFIHCILQLPVRGGSDLFCFGVWSSLSEANFRRYREDFDADNSHWDPMFGYLSNNLPGYAQTLNLKLSIQTRGQGQRPTATLEPTDHPLAIEQRDGIALEKLLDLVAPFMAQ